MNHKRGRKKDSRSGCLMCKPHKANALVGQERTREKREALKIEEIANADDGVDDCPDCDGTGRCDDCPDNICVLCGGAGVYDMRV